MKTSSRKEVTGNFTTLKRISLKAVKKIQNSARHCSRVPIKYKFKNFYIELPAYHRLNEYSEAHLLYDKFLPHLSKYLPITSTIIDVGANVGDTLAGMVEQNAKVSYICIEADGLFYSFLQSNVSKIKDYYNALKVQTINAFVGKNITNIELEGEGGTKRAIVSASGKGKIKSVRLDDIIPDQLNVRLLKSDVDGFDYDVIESGLSIVKKNRPIIFFECHFEFDFQKVGYETVIKSLQELGYCDWTVFDASGAIILRTENIHILFQLLDYLWLQNLGKTTRTMYYYDILAAHVGDFELVGKALEEYVQIPTQYN